MEELAWEEDIEQRKDGRIFHVTEGFIGDNDIRNWQVPGKAPMRACYCDTCMLHRPRRAEFLLCSVTQGRHDTYDIDKIFKQFTTKEDMEELDEGRVDIVVPRPLDVVVHKFPKVHLVEQQMVRVRQVAASQPQRAAQRGDHARYCQGGGRDD